MSWNASGSIHQRLFLPSGRLYSAAATRRSERPVGAPAPDRLASLVVKLFEQPAHLDRRHFARIRHDRCDQIVHAVDFPSQDGWCCRAGIAFLAALTALARRALECRACRGPTACAPRRGNQRASRVSHTSGRLCGARRQRSGTGLRLRPSYHGRSYASQGAYTERSPKDCRQHRAVAKPTQERSDSTTLITICVQSIADL